MPAPTAEVAESLPDPVELRNRYCRARTHALDHAHAALGQREFDRFLYEVIAPGVVLLSDVPMTADELRVVAGGCE
ncbi:MAG TPA: hypothetical protein VHW00_11765 [Thermoanaerobaculia bacterium]|nr:hypothetical protein [Thermoanaerobaculia bacterium]